MADLSTALASQSFVSDKQQRLQQPEVDPSQNAFAVYGSLKSSSVACPRPGVSAWDAGRVINPGAASGGCSSSNIGDHGRSRTSAAAPTSMSDPAKQQHQPLSSPALAYRQATTGARTHRDTAERVPPHPVAGSGGVCGRRRPAWGHVAAGQQTSDDEEDFDDRLGNGHRFDDAEDDSESSGRLPNHLLDEIWTDMGVDAMDLDFYDFSADAGGEPLATTSADVKLPSSGAAHWSPSPTSTSGVSCNVPPSVALPAAAASAVGSLDVHRAEAGAETHRDRTADPVRLAPSLGQLGTSGSLERDAKDDFGQTSQRFGQDSDQGGACQEQNLQQQPQDVRENIIDRKDAILTDVAVDGASAIGLRCAGSNALPSNIRGAAAAGVSRESSASPSAISVTSALTSGTSAANSPSDRLNGGAAATRSTSDSLAAIAKLTRSISEAGNTGRAGSSDPSSVLDAVAPYACRTAASAPDSSTSAPSPGTASCDSGSHSPAVHSPGQFGSALAQDATYAGSGSGPASRRAALPGRSSVTQLSGNLRATELLACELMGPQPTGAGGSSGAQHSRSQAMRTRGECSPYHVPSRPHSGGGGSGCTACSAACAPSGLMSATPYNHQQVPACNGRHETGRPLLGQAMPAAAPSGQPYSSDNRGRYPAAVVSDSHRVLAAGLQSSNGGSAGWAPPHTWRHHHVRSSSIPDDLEMDDLTEPDRTINFSEKLQMPNYYQVPEHGGCSSATVPAGISFNLSLGGAARSLQVPQQQQQHNPRWPAQPVPPSTALHQQQQNWQPAAGLPQAWQQQPFLLTSMPSLAPADGLQPASAQQLEQQQVHHNASSQPFASGYNPVGHHLPVQQLQLSRPDTAAAAATFARGAAIQNAHLTNSISDEPGMSSLQPKMGPAQPGSQAGPDALGAADAPESFAVRTQPGSSSSSATHQQPQPLPGTHSFMQRLIVAEGTNAFRSHPLFPLLRDLVIAEMSFDDPSFPHQLIRDLPADFEKLLHNYLARNPVLLRGVPPANQAVESVVMDALHYAHALLIEKLQVRTSAASCDGSYAAKTQPPPPPPPGYAAVSSAAAAGGGSACNGFDSDEPQRWMQARFGLQDTAASGQSAGAQVAAAFSMVADRAAATDLMYGARDGFKAENCNGVIAHSATQQCHMVRYENDAGRINYYNTIERPADSSGAVSGGSSSSLASSQGAAPGPGGLSNGHIARNDTPGRDVLLEQVQLQQRLQMQQMVAGNRSGAAERSQGSSHFYTALTVCSDRPAPQLARFSSAAVLASTHQAGSFGAYPVNGDSEASAQRAMNGQLAERLSQQHHHGYRQSSPSSADVASCRHGQATGAAVGGHMGSPSGSDASLSAEALSPPSPSAMRISSFAALRQQQQQELQQRTIISRYDRNLGSSSASPAASIISSMTSDGSPAAAVAAARKHQSLPREAVNLMTEWLREHQDKPYPNDDEKCAMIKQTGLSMQQINYWFTNARRRLLRRWQQGSADGQPPVDC